VKRPELAIDALPTLLDRVGSAHLVLAGGERFAAGFQKRLQERAERLRVGERVHFTGFVKDVVDVYAASDLLLHCAIGETFPQVVIEAMAFGLPVVALREGGPAELVVDGETGRLLAPTAGPPEVGAAVAEILEDAALAARYADGARRRAQRYSAREFAARLEGLCREVLAEIAPGPG
jgi:glycosyltransferase involved in cell wall biosynthesis